MANQVGSVAGPLAPESAPASGALRRWLRGEREPGDLLPGRPPEPVGMGLPGPRANGDGSTERARGDFRFGPLRRSADLDDTAPRSPVRAICCSGGGIRAAAFALGGMQGLGRRVGGNRSWYEDVDLVTAVSGGSYMAASFAMVDHHLTDAQRAEALPYAAGSPEDNRLRAHTRYLVEDPRVAAIGILAVLYGLLLNLLPILAGLFVIAKLLGWLLFETGALTPVGNDWTVTNVGVFALVAWAPSVLGVALFAGERLHDVYRDPSPHVRRALRTWSLRLFALAGVLLVAFVGVPQALHLLSSSRLHLSPSGISWGAQLSGFVGATTMIVAFVKGSVGRFSGRESSAAGRSGAISEYVGRAVRWLAPWAGSVAVVGLLGVAFVSWTTSAAYNGLQWSEAASAALALAGTVLWQACTDVNRNSVHPFYTERLASAFAVRRTSAGGAEHLPPCRLPPLSAYASPEDPAVSTSRRPDLVVCAAVNIDEEGVVPAGRGCAPFTFSAHLVGISSGTMFAGERAVAAESAVCADRRLLLPTADYERRAGQRLVTLPAAVAVSGAAVSPVMGRMTRAPLRLLLGVSNVRLGLWLPNPRLANQPDAPPAQPGHAWALVRWQLRQPGVRSLLAEMLGRTGLRGRWVYVTDGGHYENLGLVEALRRGATEIVVFDASGDPPHSWSAFGQAVETARADLGVEIDLDPREMAPAEGSDGAPKLVVRGSARYPNGVEATLVLCKLALPVDAPASWDVLAWAARHRSFPHDTTAQQLYGDCEFEAYRRLGELASRQALLLVPSDVPSFAQSDVHSEEPEAAPGEADHDSWVRRR